VIALKLPATLVAAVRADLQRPHPFDCERVGFIKAKQGALPNGGVVLLGYDHLVVPDNAYEKDDTVGARIAAAGFMPARQAAFSYRLSIVHVHLHDHVGRPGPSITDRRETSAFMPDFVSVARSVPHAALILSRDSGHATAWFGSQVLPVSPISIVGMPMRKMVAHAR